MSISVRLRVGPARVTRFPVGLRRDARMLFGSRLVRLGPKARQAHQRPDRPELRPFLLLCHEHPRAGPRALPGSSSPGRRTTPGIGTFNLEPERV